MTLRRCFLAWCWIGPLLAACGGDDDEGSGYTVACDQGCARAADCSSQIDAESCATQCREDLAPFGNNLSAEYVAAFNTCLNESTCGELVVAAVYDTCDLSARARVSPTETVRTFCAGVGDADRFCTRFNRETLCLEFLDIFSDAAIRRAQACLEEPCDLQQACVERELGVELGPN